MVNPIQAANLVGTIKMVATQAWDWMKGNKPGNAIWYIVVDGQASSSPISANGGDFLVGDHTFFVLSKEYQLPMQGVETNATVQIIRPNQTTGAGLQPYGGYTPANSTLIVDQMPASILFQSGRGSMAKTKLPTDTNQPTWIIMMPRLNGTDLRTGDVLIDETTQQYVLGVTESTEFGWRLTAQQMVN
ncbi:MAG TPA: hypothetical protein PLF59_08155 [Cyclobacteriaceae bacterium]|nr:hypothetical protein [Cyclobacteriaceae bacterium]